MVQCDFFSKKRKKCRNFLKTVLTIDSVCDKIPLFMCWKTAYTSKKVVKKIFLFCNRLRQIALGNGSKFRPDF